MRRSRAAALFSYFATPMLASLATLLASSSAYARPCSNSLVSTCINDDTFWPHAGPQQMLTVGGVETVAAGQIAFGLVTTYLSRPIVLHSPSPGPGGSDELAINDQVNGNFLWAYGVTNKLELDFALPLTFGQGGAGVQPITGGNSLQDTAARDLRFGLTYAILPRARVDRYALQSLGQMVGVAARFEMSAPTGDSDQFAGERSAVFIPSLAADFRRGRFFAALEGGARLRPTAELVGARIGSQITLGAGVGFDILTGKRDLLSISVEGRALPTFAEQHTSVQTQSGFLSTPNGQTITPAEWTVALRTAPLVGGDLGIQLGGGGAIPLSSDSPITVPRFRFTLSIRYAPLAHDSDGDGVLDSEDRCPHEVGIRKNGGCPGEPAPAEPAATEPPSPPPSASPVAPAPLTLRSARGVCGSDPETVDGFRDDACPDEDSDHDGIGNRHDKCPLIPEDFAGLADGCPEGQAAKQ